MSGPREALFAARHPDGGDWMPVTNPEAAEALREMRWEVRSYRLVTTAEEELARDFARHAEAVRRERATPPIDLALVMTTRDPHLVEMIAQAFHRVYERLAPEFGYETRTDSAKPWEDVPVENRRLMRATVAEVFGLRLDDEPPTLEECLRRIEVTTEPTDPEEADRVGAVTATARSCGLECETQSDDRQQAVDGARRMMETELRRRFRAPGHDADMQPDP